MGKRVQLMNKCKVHLNRVSRNSAKRDSSVYNIQYIYVKWPYIFFTNLGHH